MKKYYFLSMLIFCFVSMSVFSQQSPIKLLLGLSIELAGYSNDTRFPTKDIDSTTQSVMAVRSSKVEAGAAPIISGLISIAIGVEIRKSIDLFFTASYGGLIGFQKTDYKTTGIYTDGRTFVSETAKDEIGVQTGYFQLDFNLRYTFYFGNNSDINAFGIYVGTGGGLVFMQDPRVQYREGDLKSNISYDDYTAQTYNDKESTSLTSLNFINYNINATTGLMFKFNYFVKMFLGYKFKYYFNPLFGNNTKVLIQTKESLELSSQESGQIRELSVPVLNLEHGVELGVNFMI